MAKKENAKKKQKSVRAKSRLSGLASGTESGTGAGGLGAALANDWENMPVEQDDEMKTPNDMAEDIGSKRGFELSHQLDHQSGGTNYEVSNVETNKGMSGHKDAGPHSNDRPDQR